MAYSSVRVQFEIGHDASVRNKRTPEGFTHDWEVFVRGADNTEIQYFVEKVVFYLHETFPKPKRVIKEPPYSVKECGYAGFVLPIDVYLKNLEEPKKITFQYDLQLQSSGPPLSRVHREPRVFQNPSEDFRRKLIRGGGVGVDVPPDDSKPGSRKAEEPKHSIPNKKHKPELPLSNSFADLFGTPIRRVTPEPKKVTEVVKKIEKKKTSKVDHVKLEKDVNRDRDRDRDRDKDKDKEKIKERDRSKEKLKRPASPAVRIKEEIKIKDEGGRKFEDRDKRKEEPKAQRDEKERKDKYKERDGEKSHKKDKRPKEVDVIKKSIVLDKPQGDSDEMRDRPEKEKHKHRHKKREREKSRDKEKHKRKDKEARDRSVDKAKVKEKHRSLTPPSPSPPPPLAPPLPAPIRHPEKPRRGPLGALIKELSDSGSPASEEEDQPDANAKFAPEKLKDSKSKTKEPKKDKSPKRRYDRKRERERSTSPDRERELEQAKRMREDQERRAREEEEEERERERERERLAREREEEERLRARLREEEERKAREREEEEKRARQRERELMEAAKIKAKKEKEGRKRKREKMAIELENHSNMDSAPVQLTEDYLSQLRELQHRIMTIEDNAELQRIVKVIADTGQYEITKKTFDFDLVTLDYATVRRLQEFLSTPS